MTTTKRVHLPRAIQTFDDLPLELQLALAFGVEDTARLSDVHGRKLYVYLLGMKRCIARNRHRPWSAVYAQLLYIMDNAHTWKGEPAKAAKVVFRRYIKAIEENDLSQW